MQAATRPRGAGNGFRPTPLWPAPPWPGALAGASFKPEHLDAIAAEPGGRVFLEVHAENYMGAGGAPHRTLERIRRDHAVSLHGVAMSLGGPRRLDPAHLERFRGLVKRVEPAMVSEHLAWSSHEGICFNDLLPLPYTPATLAKLCDHIDEMQNAIERPILLENPSTYLEFAESCLSETEFLRAAAARTGCGLLLDINNVFVSCTNRRVDPYAWLADFPLHLVGEIHLAGHDRQADDDGGALLIDSHDRPVCDAVWALYRHVIGLNGAVPTLIEWDSDIPPWTVLRHEAELAQAILGAGAAHGDRDAA